MRLSLRRHCVFGMYVYSLSDCQCVYGVYISGNELNRDRRTKEYVGDFNKHVRVRIRFASVCVRVRFASVCVRISFASVCIRISFASVCVRIRFASVCVRVTFRSLRDAILERKRIVTHRRGKNATQTQTHDWPV